MRHDCPHCHGNMKQKFIRWTQIGQHNHLRNCPLCGGNIQWRFYPEEIVSRVATVVVLIVAGYIAKERQGGYLLILLGTVAAIGVIYFVTSKRLAGAQRFQKHSEIAELDRSFKRKQDDDDED